MKCLTVVDEFTREGLAIRVARSLTAADVTRVLAQLFARFGRPACLRGDNGPELVSTRVQQWLKDRKVDTHYIEPGSPWQNAYNESFNSIFRTTCLDRWLFGSLTEARVVIEHWPARFTGRNESREVPEELDPGTHPSPTRNPNTVSGPEILGLPARVWLVVEVVQPMHLRYLRKSLLTRPHSLSIGSTRAFGH